MAVGIKIEIWNAPFFPDQVRPRACGQHVSSIKIYFFSLDLSSETGVVGGVGPGPAASMSDLPPGIELSKLTGLGLADLEDKLANYDKNTNSLGG